MKYVGILFTYYIIILEGGEGSHDDVDFPTLKKSEKKENRNTLLWTPHPP